jgi:hypothetical protein
MLSGLEVIMRLVGLVGAALVAGAVGGAVVGASLVRANELGDEEGDSPVNKADIPANVLATATRFSDGLDLERAFIADEDGVQVYELQYHKGDRRLEVQTSKAGELFATEEKVFEKAVPALVKQRAATLFEAGAKVQYERTMVVVYEAGARDENGHETEYLVNQAGAAFQEIARGVAEKAR